MSATPDHAPALLIALTGRPGQGRTRLLRELADDFRRRGQRVEGLLAIAGERPAPDRGATRYDLQVLGEPTPRPWAIRASGSETAGGAHYTFDAATRAHLEHWAAALRAQPPVPLLVLDEFGKFEAGGAGLMPLWPTLAPCAEIAVLSVREEWSDEIERRLGRRFDARVAANSPTAAADLQQLCSELGEWTRLGLYGGAAGAMEVSLGTLLHATRVPLRGLALSSAQAGVMTLASAGLAQPGRVMWVPFISAGLKALAPSTSRVRPMIAICAQGVLFAGSVQALGWNLLGVVLGGALVGSWAASQGFFLQYLLLGDSLFDAYRALTTWLAERWQITAPQFSVVLGAWAALHAFAAASVAFVAWRWRVPPGMLQRAMRREALPPGATAPEPSRARRVGREVLRWQLWLPLALVSAVLLATGRPWEHVAWIAVRFIAAALVLFAVLSYFRPARWPAALRRRGWWGPAAAFHGAFKTRS